jgi:hypothetical protein
VKNHTKVMIARWLGWFCVAVGVVCGIIWVAKSLSGKEASTVLLIIMSVELLLGGVLLTQSRSQSKPAPPAS